MDKKNLRHTWIVNMYQKFEAVCQDVCQDVEEFVNKGHVKYVENHMQTVGESVKKFYNGVVQDLMLPPLIDTYTNSVTVIKENTIHNNTNKSEQSPLVSVTHCRKLSPTCEIIKSPVQEEDTNPDFQHVGNDVIKKKIPNTIDNNTNSEEGSLDSTENCHKKSPTCELSKSPVQEEDTNPNFQLEGDDVIKKNIPNTIENNTSKSEEGPLNSTENCHEKSPTCEIIKSPVEEEDTNPNFEHEGDDVINNTSLIESGMLHNSILESDDSVFEDEDWGIENIIDLNLDMDKKTEGGQMAFPFIKESEKVRVETLIKDFEFFLKIQESSETESLINENKEEKSCNIISPRKLYDSSSSMEYISASSHDLSSCESSTSTKFPSSNFAPYNGSNELDGSMGDFEDIDMDTIDLSDKEELVESGVIVEGEKVFSFQYGPRKSKSYKKIIRDAFMSRKKLTKEYKQLAIWCGDIDKEFSQQKEKIATKIQVQDFPDSEWEIL